MPYRLVPARGLARFGRRGLVLLLFGMAWMLEGFYLILDRHSHVTEARQAIPHDLIPWPFVGLLWLAFGAVGASVGFLHKDHDHLGFLAISAMPLFFTSSFFVSFLTWVLTMGTYGWGFGILAAFIWGSISVLIGVLSSWPEPTSPDRGPSP